MPCFALDLGTRTRTIDGTPSDAVFHGATPASTGTRITVTLPGSAGPRRPNRSVRVFGSQARPSTFSPPASGSRWLTAASDGTRRSNQSRNPGIASVCRSPWAR